jgi:hypothetical protein
VGLCAHTGSTSDTTTAVTQPICRIAPAIRFLKPYYLREQVPMKSHQNSVFLLYTKELTANINPN